MIPRVRMMQSLKEEAQYFCSHIFRIRPSRNKNFSEKKPGANTSFQKKDIKIIVVDPTDKTGFYPSEKYRIRTWPFRKKTPGSGHYPFKEKNRQKRTEE